MFSAEATITTAVAWSIWKRRNTLIFNHVDDSLSVTVRRCIEDVRLWAYRCSKPASAVSLYNWCIAFDPP
jgi:hypothetical protein